MPFSLPTARSSSSPPWAFSRPWSRSQKAVSLVNRTVTHNESLALNPPIQRPSGFGIKPPTNNLHWGNPNHGFIHRIICTKQGVSSCRYGVRSPPDLHPARLPGWQDIINHQRDIWVFQDVAKLLGPAEVPPANVDHIEFGIVAETNGCDLRSAVRPNGCQTPQALAEQILHFLVSKDTHR